MEQQEQPQLNAAAVAHASMHGTEPSDPRLTVQLLCCSRCGQRYRPDDTPACHCIDEWRWEMRLFWVYAVLILVAMGVAPILVLIFGKE